MGHTASFPEPAESSDEDESSLMHVTRDGSCENSVKSSSSDILITTPIQNAKKKKDGNKYATPNLRSMTNFGLFAKCLIVD